MQQYDKKCMCDGILITRVSKLYIEYPLFFEVKNKIGLGESDLTIQDAIYYRDHWVQPNVSYSILRITQIHI